MWKISGIMRLCGLVKAYEHQRRLCSQESEGWVRKIIKIQSADETLKRTTGEQDSGIEPEDANKRLL